MKFLNILCFFFLVTSLNAQFNNKEIDDLFEKAFAEMNQQEFEKALYIFDEIIEKDPKNKWAYVERGNCLLILGNHIEAIKSCDKALVIDDQFIPGYKIKAFSYGGIEDHISANKVYDKILRLEPDNEEGLRGKAWEETELGNYQESIEYNKRVLANNPNSIFDIYVFATTNRYAGNKKEEIRGLKFMLLLADSLLAIEPSNMTGMYWKAGALSELESNEKDLEVYHYLIEQNFRVWPSWAHIAQVHFENHNYEEGFQAFNEILKFNEYAYNFAWRAYSLIKLGKYDLALKDIEKALEKAPKYYWGRSLKAECLIAKGKSEAALAICETLIEEIPKRPEAYKVRGLAHLDLGNKEAACLDLIFAQELGYNHRYRNDTQIETLLSTNCQ